VVATAAAKAEQRRIVFIGVVKRIKKPPIKRAAVAVR